MAITTAIHSYFPLATLVFLQLLITHTVLPSSSIFVSAICQLTLTKPAYHPIPVSGLDYARTTGSHNILAGSSVYCCSERTQSTAGWKIWLFLRWSVLEGIYTAALKNMTNCNHCTCEHICVCKTPKSIKKRPLSSCHGINIPNQRSRNNADRDQLISHLTFTFWSCT